MFDLLFDIVCGEKYNTMIFTEDYGVLYGIPCESDSGCSAVYSEKVELSNTTAFFHTSGNDYDQEGIMITKESKRYKIEHVYYNERFGFWEQR